MLKKQRMLRIDDARCNGCGNCVTASRGAIVLRHGKAYLARETEASKLRISPDVCPEGAIYYVERTVGAYALSSADYRLLDYPVTEPVGGALRQWPLELEDFTGDEPFWAGARVVLASPGAAVAFPGVWESSVLVICPRCAPVEPLATILGRQSIVGIVVVRSPGGDGLLRLAKAALQRVGKRIPVSNICVF